jgi:CRISPR/Cas system CSM-associated protein Csm2 small subunit
MKLLAHSVEELAARQMVILLPLYLLKCRKAAVKKPTKELAEELRKLIDEMIQTLDGRKTAGELTGEDVRVLVSLLNRLYEYLYGHIQLFEAEGVNRMLADRLVLDVDIAKKKGREEGIEHGHTQGLEEVTLEMLKEGEPIDKIIRFTHFPRERIQALHDRL